MVIMISLVHCVNHAVICCIQHVHVPWIHFLISKTKYNTCIIGTICNIIPNADLLQYIFFMNHSINSSLFTGMLTNLRDIVIAAYQEVSFSNFTRTAGFVDGAHDFISEPGAYRFATFTVENHAQVTLASSAHTLLLGQLELFYGAQVQGGQLFVESNEIWLHPGSVLNLTGGGYSAGSGPGAGGTVSIYTQQANR